MRTMKAIIQALATVLAAIVPAFAAGPLDATGWFNVIVLAMGAIMVYNAANIPGWNYAKLIASAVSAVVVLLISVWEGGLTTPEIMQLILAFLGALGVGAIPNGEGARAA